MRLLVLLVLSATLACGDNIRPIEPATAFVLDDDDSGVGGPMASARSGDILLSNSLIQVAIQKPGRSFGLNPFGGNIIDADLVRDGGGLDHFGELGLLVNLKFTFAPEDYAISERAGVAEVRFRGSLVLQDFLNVPFMTKEQVEISPAFDSDEVPALEVARIYRLGPASRTVEVETVFHNPGTEDQALLIADIVDAGGDTQRYSSSKTPGGVGADAFREELLSVPHRLSLVTPRGVSYGLHHQSTSGSALIDAVGVLFFARDTRVTELLSFPVGAKDVVPAGGSLRVVTLFSVGSGDVASLDLEHFRVGDIAHGFIDGQVDIGISDQPAPRARVAIKTSEGDDVSLAIADDSGRFSAWVVPGDYTLHAYREGHEVSDFDTLEVTVAEGESVGADLSVGDFGRIDYQVRDADGELLPARVTVLGFDSNPPTTSFIGGSKDPLPHGVAAMEFSDTGEGSLFLEPGDWLVVFTRGSEYELVTVEVELVRDRPAMVEATLRRVVDTTGYVAADFHVHAAASSDSQVLMTERIRSFVAEGMEFFAATEHETVVDPRPLIDELGLADWIGATTGEEISTAGYGHWNVYPLPLDERSHNGGAIAFSDGARSLTPEAIYALARKGPGEEIVQINHPRRAPVNLDWQEYFSMIDLAFGPEGPVVGPDAIDPGLVRIDESWSTPTGFDAIEVYNWANVGALVDWWNFLNFGYRVAGTANTDTHSVRLEVGGFPRTYVRVGVDEPRLVSDDDIVAAIKNQHLTVCGGPFVTLRANVYQSEDEPVGEGEILGSGGDLVELHVRVQSPTWIEWDSVELYENGMLIEERLGAFAASSQVTNEDGGRRREYNATFQVTPIGDAWYVALVRSAPGRNLFPWVPYNTGGDLTFEDLRASEVEGAPRGMSFTNPVYVDQDSDGELQPSRIVVDPASVDVYEEQFDRRTPIAPFE